MKKKPKIPRTLPFPRVATRLPSTILDLQTCFEILMRNRYTVEVVPYTNAVQVSLSNFDTEGRRIRMTTVAAETPLLAINQALQHIPEYR